MYAEIVLDITRWNIERKNIQYDNTKTEKMLFRLVSSLISLILYIKLYFSDVQKACNVKKSVDWFLYNNDNYNNIHYAGLVIVLSVLLHVQMAMDMFRLLSSQFGSLFAYVFLIHDLSPDL